QYPSSRSRRPPTPPPASGLAPPRRRPGLLALPIEVASMRLVRPLVLAGLTLALAAPASPAADEPARTGAPVSYYRDVRPLFSQHCQGCHQPAIAKGSYVMTSYGALFKKGDHDQDPILPGKPDDSLLVDQMTPNKDGKAEMPKGKDPLPAKDLALLPQRTK